MGQLQCSSAITEIHGRLGMQARGHRVSLEGITLLVQLKCTSTITEIHGRLGMQARGHRDSHEGITLATDEPSF
jgi:hypothetical protein